MIPAPDDQALPALGVALEGEAMRELLTQSVPECRSGELAVDSCRPCYARYKPGTSCVVQYELALSESSTGTRMVTTAHVRLFADATARQTWDRRSFQRLLERAARRHPGPPACRAAYVPKLGAIVQIYPVDSKLPALVRATSARKMRRVLRDLFPEGDIVKKPGIGLVRYKPARKALLRYGLRPEQPAVYVKLYADADGARRFRIVRELFSAGVRVPRPLAYVPDFRMALQAEADGTRLADLRGTPSFANWLEPAASALAELHATRVDGVLPSPAGDEASAVVAAGRAVAALRPALADESELLAGEIAARLRRLEGDGAPLHGDFYDDQLLVSDGRVVLLDFDESRRGHPLVDVGNFTAHLSARLAARDAERARELFVDSYERLGSHARSELALFEAAGLVKLAVGPFRRLEPDWPDQVERLFSLAAARLAEHRPGGVRRLGPTPVDPALPQLETLTDHERIRAVLASAYGTDVEVHGISLVRHKAGRRCTLRYDLRFDDGGRGRLFGKTFASDRGPRVFRALRALADVRACGSAVAFPEPVAYVPPLKLLLQEEVPGRPVEPALLAGDSELAVAIADGLASLHASGVELDRTHSLALEIAALRDWVDAMAAAAPALARPARRCLSLVEARARRGWHWRRRPVHRDFYHHQVLATEDGIAFLDFDDAAMSEPALDVANFLAHLRLLGLQHPGESEAADECARAFMERYAERDGELDPALVRFLEGATLLRLAAIHLPRPWGELIAPRLLAESELRLAGACSSAYATAAL